MGLIKRIFPWPLFLTLAVGCGSGFVKPHGRITRNGQALLPGNNESVHVVFFPAGEWDSDLAGAYPANFDRTEGSFQVVGPDGKGMPPGKYRITVKVMKNRKDLLGGAFGPRNSPLVRDITSSSEERTCDLVKPEG